MKSYQKFAGLVLALFCASKIFATDDAMKKLAELELKAAQFSVEVRANSKEDPNWIPPDDSEAKKARDQLCEVQGRIIAITGETTTDQKIKALKSILIEILSAEEGWNLKMQRAMDDHNKTGLAKQNDSWLLAHKYWIAWREKGMEIKERIERLRNGEEG